MFEQLPATITSAKGPAYKRQELEWQMINALLGGTGAMRDWRQTYLPALDNETTTRYNKRLAKAVLAPFFKRAVAFSAGKAFFRPIIVQSVEKGKVSDKMQAVINDANRKSDSLNKFAASAFKDGLSKGLGYIYVEADSYDPQQVRTEAEFKAANVRPYMLYLPAEDVLDIDVDDNGNIIYAKILERYTRFNTALKTTEETTRLRLVTPQWIGVYEQEQVASTALNKKTGLFNYHIAKEPMVNALGKVPLVPFYAGEKKTEFEAVSPFIDLAYTNVQYYQDESTHEMAISVAEFPILVGKGKGTDIEIGPHKIVIVPADGDLRYVEHSGAALEAGRKNLEELRVKAAYCGLKALASDSSSGGGRTKTASEAEMDYIDTNSDLKVAADAFADALNMALWYVQRYLGEIQDGEQSKYMAKMNGMFAVTASDVQEIVALMNLESSGKMRIESLYKELKRRGAIADDFDIESETAYAAENADNPEGV